jgi:hypothetical protein
MKKYILQYIILIGIIFLIPKLNLNADDRIDKAIKSHKKRVEKSRNTVLQIIDNEIKKAHHYKQVEREEKLIEKKELFLNQEKSAIPSERPAEPEKPRIFLLKLQNIIYPQKLYFHNNNKIMGNELNDFRKNNMVSFKLKGKKTIVVYNIAGDKWRTFKKTKILNEGRILYNSEDAWSLIELK